MDFTLSKEQIKAFASAMEQHKDALNLLKHEYMAAQAREKELRELFNAVYNEVLDEHEFYAKASKGPERFGLKAGDRITNELDSCLMSDKDYIIFMKYAQEKEYARGYVDEQGYYNDGYNGFMTRLAAENALIDFQLSILPKKLQAALKDVKTNYTIKKKFLDIIMQSV